MRFEDDNESSNIEDRRDEVSSGGGLPFGGRTIGIGTVALALVAMYFGVDPRVILNSNLSSSPQPQTHHVARQHTAQEDQLAHFVGVVLKDTEKTWHEIFAAQGARYVEPRLVLFRGVTHTACGTGQSAMGPFYCPNDQRVYIDLDFYNELQQRFKAPGDFAQAYVIAHEVGHHVQNLLGISEKVHTARQRLSEAKGNALSVKLELQADCFAGVWAHHADAARKVLETGDVEEALTAASAIGDDALQKQSRGYVVPESFTHGSSEQRIHWFKTGLESGNINSCNTFKTKNL